MTRYGIVSFIAVFLSLGCASAIAQEEQQPVTDSGAVATQGVSDSVVFAMVNSQAGKQQTPAPAKKTEVPRTQAPSHNTPSSNSVPKWEIEIHGGYAFYHLAGTSVQLPSAATYLLAGSGAKGYTSIRASSWYFGDGATLIGLCATATGGSCSSLDPILGSRNVQPQRPVFGFRASRVLTKHLAAEFTFDRGGRLAMSKGALNQVESANDGFYNIWKRLNVAGNTPSASVSTVAAYGGYQIFTTGAIVISPSKQHKVSPFLTLGAGVLSSSGSPTVTLAGSYGGPDALETDTVHLTFAQDSSHVITGVLGGGLKIRLTQHLGIRLDARAYVYSNPINTLLDANHTNTPNAAWVVNATGGTSVPSFQRLIGPGLSAYSTLSGPALTGFTTFSASRIQYQLPVTLGLFWRF